MRLIKNAIVFLVSLMVTTSATTVPTVTRRFSSEQVGPESVIRVTLEVSFPKETALPRVWLLTENWPSGWVMEDARWNGLPYPALTIAEQTMQGWLFGETDTPASGSGTLSYLLHAPQSLASSATMNTASGAVFTYNDYHYIEGAETLRSGEATQPAVVSLVIPPGWSLMALPCELDAVGRETLSGLSDAVAGVAGEELSFMQEDLPPMGKPFWLHNPCDEVVFCDFTAEVIENHPEPLCAALPIRHRQWNLFGVCGDDPVRLADGVSAWRWQPDGYERCGENAILQPGEAVWIFVE